jgi:hypothetical protein
MYEPTLHQGRSFNRVGENAQKVLYLRSFRIDPRTNQCWPTLAKVKDAWFPIPMSNPGSCLKARSSGLRDYGGLDAGACAKSAPLYGSYPDYLLTRDPRFGRFSLLALISVESGRSGAFAFDLC